MQHPRQARRRDDRDPPARVRRRRTAVGRVPRQALRLRPADDVARARAAGADLRRRPLRARASGAPRASPTAGSRCRTPRPRSPSAIDGPRPLPRRVRPRRRAVRDQRAAASTRSTSTATGASPTPASPSCRPCPGTSTAGDPNDLQVQIDSLAALRRRGHQPVLTGRLEPADRLRSALPVSTCLDRGRWRPACRPACRRARRPAGPRATGRSPRRGR